MYETAGDSQAQDVLAKARADGQGGPSRTEANGMPAANHMRHRSGQAAESSFRQPDEKATPEQRELVRLSGSTMTSGLSPCFWFGKQTLLLPVSD